MTLNVKFGLLLLTDIVILVLLVDLAKHQSHWARWAAAILLMMLLVSGYLLYKPRSKEVPSALGLDSSKKYLIGALVFLGIVASAQTCYDLFLMLTQGPQSYIFTGLGIHLGLTLLCFFAASRVRRKSRLL